ncbi:hypothetical protein QF000_001126 [Paraburkholderia atlantica]|uniref:Lipoprotein n=1 Tax=Paraburkholderia atlantica TaxID=2654982 RepID=A0A6I1Q595_PARAM|nr:hypothetical protein [Paraburkholderia atlantica]MBB5424074.1 hypothetical protein [Paraburkholderia atlantica]MPW08212.1 hypothetical protein [Paraburkholderia atlantica]NUY31006.1 hypothetical protein [Paraburkholderia atlantica]
MKHLTKTFFASALVMAMSAITYAQVGGSADRTTTPRAGAGLTKTPSGRGNDSPDVTGSGVGKAGSSRSTGPSRRGKANGLNMGTRDGANSDVNRPRNGPRQDGQ